MKYKYEIKKRDGGLLYIVRTPEGKLYIFERAPISDGEIEKIANREIEKLSPRTE